MHNRLTAALALAVVLGGCRSATVESERPVGGQPAPVTVDAIPAGTIMEVELNQTLGTDESRVGDRFTATVVRPLVAANGQVVVPQGALVHGVVTGLDDSDHVGDQAAIRIDFDRLTYQGRTYPFSADVVDTDVRLVGEGERAAAGAATGAIAGAALGAIIGGDLQDILIGGALGAGAGTIISLGIGSVDAQLPRGTEMTLRTRRTISLR